MKCSVYVATSIDGFTATNDGRVDWLYTAGNTNADMGDQADMGFKKFMESVDCLIMGRATMEVISGFNLTSEQWPYGDTKIIVLSNSLKQPPDNLKGKVEMYSGDIRQLVSNLEGKGFSHAYIDGAKTIQSFLDFKLIDEMILTHAPVILGEGIPLFAKATQSISFGNASAVAFPNDFVQIRYTVIYE